MSCSYFGFSVSNTNASGNRPNAVRVYNSEGIKIAEVNPNKRNPLAYVKQYRGKIYRDLRNQCLAGGMTPQEFDLIFGGPKQ